MTFTSLSLLISRVVAPRFETPKDLAPVCSASQSCLTLCNPMGCSPPGSSVHEILQVRILEWVAIPYSRARPDPGIEPRSPASQADSLPSEPPGCTEKH